MAGYNPSWLENMYMGKYETEEERLKREQAVPTISSPTRNVGSDYRTYQTDSNIAPDIAASKTSIPAGTETKDKAVSGKLGAADYVGIGLQLVGAMNADKEARRQEEKDDKKYSEAKQSAARQREDELRQVQEQLQRQDRGMNMQGLDMLAQQRERAYSKRVSNSMANTFARAIRG